MIKKEKILLGLLTLIICLLSLINLVSAVDTTTSLNNNIDAYWAFENLTDETGNYTLTNVGATSGVTGIINNSYFFDGSNDYMTQSSFSITDGDSYSVSFWVNPDDLSGGDTYSTTNPRYIIVFSDTSFSVGLGGIRFHGDRVAAYFYDGSGFRESWTNTGAVSTGTWQHVVVVVEPSQKVKFYVDGVLQTNDASNNPDVPISGFGNNDDGIYIGQQSNNQRYYEGDLDEFLVYDGVLSSDYISFLYASGSPTSEQQYPFSVLNSNFTITVTDYWNDNTINSFWAYMNGTNYTTTNGTIITPFYNNNTNNYTIQIGANNYFTKIYNNYDVSTNLNAELEQNKITFQTKEIITNNTLSGVNYTIDGETLTEFPLSNGTYNVTASKDTYYSITQEFTVTTLEDKTISLEGMYNNIINLSITDTEGNDINTSWSNIILGSGSVINGSDIIESLQGNNFTISLGGGDYFTENVSANTDNNYTLIEKSLFSKNQLYINFKDLINKTTITDQVNYSIKSDDIEYSGSTTSGSVSLEVIDGNYLITAESSSYEDSTYILDVPSSPSEQNISIYMRSSEGLTPIQFLVIDNFDDEVEDAIVNVQRLINGTSYSIGQKYTDFTGSTIFNLDQEIEYIIIASKNGYDTFTGTVTPSSTSYTLRINEQGAEPQESIFENVYFDTGYSYDNTTINFTLLVTSSNSGLQQYSVETVYDGTTYREQVIDSPSGGVITLSIPFNSSVQSEFDVDYSFTYNDKEYSWTETYNVVDIDKYDTDFSDMTSKTKVVVATIVLLIMIAIGMAVGGVIGSYVGGIIGLGVLTFTSILSVGGGIIGLTIVIILISIMNRDGDIV